MTQRPSYATVSHRESFKHENLKLSENSIRLFQVQPGSKEGPISLRITQYAIHKQPPYKAISYTWGSAAEPSPVILVNGRSFHIHRNLWNLMYHLRQRKELSFLWADRMCIDQANLAERNFHVQLMGKIYDQATSVIVWLGLPSEDRTEIRAIDFIKEIALLRKTMMDRIVMEKLLIPDLHHRWQTLLRMLRHRYWGRTWIIQEFLRAPSIELLCGTASLSWRDLDDLLSLLQQPNVRNHPFILPISDTRPVRLSVRRRAKIASNLRELLTEYHDSVCTERRDKVYGILGLASDCADSEGVSSRGVKPDYKKHIVEVYLDTVTCISTSLPSTTLVPSAANLVFRALLLTHQDLVDYVTNNSLESLNSLPPLLATPYYVSTIQNVTPWSSISDLKQKLTKIDWGDYVGYQITSPRPGGLGRRSSSRAVHTALPDDLISNIINTAEIEDVTALYNYESPTTNTTASLEVSPTFITSHQVDKQSFDNPRLLKPPFFIDHSNHLHRQQHDNDSDQNDQDRLRIGFACTNARNSDQVIQFRGLDCALIVRTGTGTSTSSRSSYLIGKAVLVKHCRFTNEGPLDQVCVKSPWLSACPVSNGSGSSSSDIQGPQAQQQPQPSPHVDEPAEYQTDALSLAELIMR